MIDTGSQDLVKFKWTFLFRNVPKQKPFLTLHEGDSLYSVKWYRNGQEFYRHIPTDRPQTVVFRQAGLIVDVSISVEFIWFVIYKDVDFGESV